MFRGFGYFFSAVDVRDDVGHNRGREGYNNNDGLA